MVRSSKLQPGKLSSRDKAQESLDQPPPDLRMCPCGVAFTPRRKDQIYHSTQCRDSFYAKITTHECPICKIVHKPSVGTAGKVGGKKPKLGGIVLG